MRAFIFQAKLQAWHRAARGAGACFVVLALLMSAMAVAQEAKPREEPGFFEDIAAWFDRNVGSAFQGAGKQVETFGHEAGVAAKTTVNGAKDAAGAVARIPAARVMAGHEKCQNAPNGAPDCLAAAERLCKGKGFENGKSLDMTTAEVCPPKVMLSGRTGAAGECRDETFVSRALCQ
jgi:hypothetical protein